VNPNLQVPHPKAASLDHIVPVSLGGDHSEANLQLAHFSCNSKKRNKVNGNGEQLRLAV
jgi:5-methylcytosine-specific restriction endonuclease McrA